MTTPEDASTLRSGVIDFSKQFDQEELKEKSLNELTEFLSEKAGREVKIDKLKEIPYMEHMDPTSKFYEDSPVFCLNNQINIENESLERIGKLLDKPVKEMIREELKDSAISKDAYCCVP